MKCDTCGWSEPFVVFMVPFRLNGTTIRRRVKKNECTIYISAPHGVLLPRRAVRDSVFMCQCRRGEGGPQREYLLFFFSSGTVLNGEQCH